MEICDICNLTDIVFRLYGTAPELSHQGIILSMLYAPSYSWKRSIAQQLSGRPETEARRMRTMIP